MKDTRESDISSLQQLPDLETFRDGLEKLKAMDLSAYSQEEIHSVVYTHTRVVPSFVWPIPAEEVCKYRFYRARFNIDPEKENVYLYSTFSYPPNAFCSENGRANLKRRNVFYCADSPAAAILESKPRKGDRGSISEWRPVVDRTVMAGVFFRDNLRKDNRFHQDAKDLHAYLKTVTPQFSADKSAHLDALNDFFCSLFCEEKPPYSISSWLANNLLYSHREIDMILYPSSTTESVFTNLAIHPNFADRYLRLEKIFQCEVDDITEKKLNYGLGLIGVPGFMNLEWRNPSQEEMQEIVDALNQGIDPRHIKGQYIKPS